MSSQERPRPSKSSRETYTADDAYETGETTLDLDSVSNTDLDSLSFEEDADAYSPSLQTLSGLSLILAGLVYLVTEISASPVSALFHPDLILPWLLGTTVLPLRTTQRPKCPQRLQNPPPRTRPPRAVG
jgi:phage shock protein C